MGRDPSTVSREIRRAAGAAGAEPGEPYRARDARCAYESRGRASRRPRRLDSDPGLRERVPGPLQLGHSPQQIPGMDSIHDRPAETGGRSVPGHWEGGLTRGAGNRSAVGVLSGRTGRYIILARMDGLRAQDANEAFARAPRNVPRRKGRTMTHDQGREIARRRELARRLRRSHHPGP